MAIYEMLAINIDGTLLTNGNRLHKLTKEAIEFVQKKGVKVTLYTSRNFSSAKKVANHLNLLVPIITNDGSYISTTKDEPIYIKRLGENTTLEIVKLLETFPCQINLISENELIGNKYKFDRTVIGNISFRNNLFDQAKQYFPSLTEELQTSEFNPLSIRIQFDDNKTLKSALSSLETYKESIKVSQLDNNILNISAKNISKLDGLLYLSDYLKIKMEETVVIGDSIDDLEAITAAGLGVAMGNAPAEVKRAANWITRSNNEQGVAYMVKEHFRKQQRISFLRELKT